MAELTRDPCCTPESQESCCEPQAKTACCGEGDACNCAAGEAAPGDIREQDRRRYAAATQVIETR